MSNLVTLHREGNLALLHFNRPEVLNALNQAMWGELVGAIQSIGQDSELRVAILTGEGRAFCVGADLKETAWRDETQGETRRRIERNQQQLAREMIQSPVPIIAAINGYALGGGVEIALAADIRIASEKARFGFPETTIGRFISGGASLLLPRVVGLSHAKRLVFTGQHIDAAEAKEIGLVDDVVSADALLDQARVLAATIAGNAPVSVSLAKKAFNRVALAEIESALALETESLIATYATDDNNAGVAAFASRDKADFAGH